MVIASGRVGQESAIRYTKAMLDLYKSAYQAMSPAFNPFEFMQPAAPASQRPAPQHEQSISEPPVSQDSTDVTVLQQRLAELERQVSNAYHGKAQAQKTEAKAAPSAKGKMIKCQKETCA